MLLIQQSTQQLYQTALLVVFYLTSVTALAGNEYIGRDTCDECHAEQAKLWQGSHHDLAMQHVSDDTVLADFSNTTFSYAGVTS